MARLTRELDFSNAEDFAIVSGLIGYNEALFQERFPNVFQGVENARRNGLPAKSNTGLSSRLEDVFIQFFNKSGKITGRSYLQLTSFCSAIFLTYKILDMDTQKIVGSGTFGEFGSCQSEMDFQSDDTLNPQTLASRYKIETLAVWKGADADQLRVIDNTTTLSKQQLMRDFTCTITVDAPKNMSGASSPGRVISISNGRNGNFDYVYTPLKYSQTSPRGVYALCPMKGSVTFGGDAKVDSIITDGVFPTLLWANKGSLEYNKKISQDNFSISSDRKSFSWELDYDWNDVFTGTATEGELPLRLYLPIAFMLEGEAEKQVIAIVSYDPSGFPYGTPDNTAWIGPIQYMWGCFAKGTSITLANGSKRPVEQIATGDSLKSIDGATVKVKGIEKGEDVSFFRIRATNDSSEEDLVITKGHPIYTRNGFKPVDELSTDDDLYYEEDGYQFIYGCWESVEESPVEVYSITLENSELPIFANGIAVGDFVKQNTQVHKPQVKEDGNREEYEMFLKYLKEKQ
jgi:hypothetical protein